MEARRAWPVRAAAVAVGLLVFGTAAAVAAWGGASSSAAPLIGRVAPAISGRTLEGDRVDLAAWRGRWVVVNFFAPWCAECLVEHDDLVHLAQDLGDEGLVVSVVVDAPADDVTSFLRDRPASWPFVLDPAGRTAVAYGQVRVPETFLIGPDSTVVAKFEGAVEAAAVQRLIRST
jgi:thiol-disulfide isomerase/thioredoxin